MWLGWGSLPSTGAAVWALIPQTLFASSLFGGEEQDCALLFW